ncbi:MAG: type II toxin-antitoxin system death-on-curing family toxin [Puniceicoccales bacterium]|jgi:death-on-curing protein|nr:type II toxin-antitoxin system death-on-curing family toxin [Puniceicoccales bacterium]
MKPDEINYLEYDTAVAAHNYVIENSGGAFGLRDEALLVSALQRPKNLAHYKPASDIFELAATLLTGIALNHPFFDGNKRCATMCALMFLSKNGVILKKMDAFDSCTFMISVVTHKVSDDDVANFLRNLAGKNFKHDCDNDA